MGHNSKRIPSFTEFLTYYIAKNPEDSNDLFITTLEVTVDLNHAVEELPKLSIATAPNSVCAVASIVMNAKHDVAVGSTVNVQLKGIGRNALNNVACRNDVYLKISYFNADNTLAWSKVEKLSAATYDKKIDIGSLYLQRSSNSFKSFHVLVEMLMVMPGQEIEMHSDVTYYYPIAKVQVMDDRPDIDGEGHIGKKACIRDSIF